MGNRGTGLFLLSFGVSTYIGYLQGFIYKIVEVACTTLFDYSIGIASAFFGILTAEACSSPSTYVSTFFGVLPEHSWISLLLIAGGAFLLFKK